MFRKASVMDKHLDPNIAESFADLLFEIGKDQLENKQYELAVRWLERSYDVLLEQDLERLSSDAGELRISIIEKTGASCDSIMPPVRVNVFYSQGIAGIAE